MTEQDTVNVSNWRDEIPLVTVTQEQVDSKTQCSICLEEYTRLEKVRRLECAHIFHDQCLSPWLERNNICPSCRRLHSQIPIHRPEVITTQTHLDGEFFAAMDSGSSTDEFSEDWVSENGFDMESDDDGLSYGFSDLDEDNNRIEVDFPNHSPSSSMMSDEDFEWNEEESESMEEEEEENQEYEDAHANEDAHENEEPLNPGEGGSSESDDSLFDDTMHFDLGEDDSDFQIEENGNESDEV